MAVVASFKVEGFPELFEQMNNLKEEIGKQKTDRLWRGALTSAMQPVLDAAKANAPKNTGQLADHIYLKVHRPKNRDKNSKYYFGEEYMARVSVSPLREDTESHFVLNKRGRVQHTYRGKKPVAVSQEFGNARVPAHPFMRLALETNYQTVISILETSLKSIIEEIARQKMRNTGS
jgi:HK97 gp10 family phage protein